MKFVYFLVYSLCFLSVQNLWAQTNGSFTFGGQNRTYIAYVPSGYVPGSSLPLVFVLHGFTQSAQAIMNYSGFNTVAEANNFIAVYPNGVGNAWNTNSGFPGGSTADDVGFISALIDTMHATYGIDTASVFSCGFSAGGFMSHLLACELGNRITAIAAVGGTMSDAAFNACQPSRPVPVLQIHGTADAVVSYNGSFANVSVNNTINFWQDFNACPATANTTNLPDLVNEGSTVEHITYAPCAQNTAVELLKVTNGGHTWPGATGTSGIGNTNQDISASAEIWFFFSRFVNPIITGLQPLQIQLQENPLHIYPNPASQYIVVQSNRAATYNILDAMGKPVMQGTLNPMVTQIDLGNLAAGLYFLEVENHKTQVFSVSGIGR